MICYFVEMTDRKHGWYNEAYKAFESEEHFAEWMREMADHGIAVTAYACGEEDCNE